MKPFYFAKRKLQLARAAIILVALAISIPLSAQTITTFDAPGAGTGPHQGTYALCINPSGTIIGFVRGANEVRHGFVRSQDGSFTIFDAPGGAREPARGREPTPSTRVVRLRDSSVTQSIRPTATFAPIKA